MIAGGRVLPRLRKAATNPDSRNRRSATPVAPPVGRRAVALCAVMSVAGGLPAATPTLPDGTALPFAATAEMRAQLGDDLPRGAGRRMQAIVDLIFSTEQGLDFRYRRRPTLTAAEAWEERAGNCLSLVNLFVALARSAGLGARFVEVEDYEIFYREQGIVVRSEHIVGGVFSGGELLTVDFLPGRPKRYYRLQPISDQRAIAHYYKAIATEALVDNDLERSRRLFELALDIDPEFADTWNNYAILRRRQDDFAGAFEALETALELDPELLPALENLSGLYRRTGELERAEAVSRQILELKTGNPFYLVAEGERLIEAEQLDEAERLLRRARRLQSDIPEIYFHLAKIELARGRDRQADRLLRKARSKSERFSEVFQGEMESRIRSLLAAHASPP